MRESPPRNVPAYAVECLRALAAEGLGEAVSVGGGVGLLQYLDYRATHDLDLWWNPAASSDRRAQVLAAAEAVLKAHGAVRRRQWGDVVSTELVQDGRVVFSVQVASRDAMLEAPKSLGWVAVMADGIHDLLASKMVALIERGAPRDFRDIRAVCAAGIAQPAQCWQLWEQRVRAAGTSPDHQRAALAVQTHLARIAGARPLEQIADEPRRTEARELRQWFADVFLSQLPGSAP